MRGCAPSFLISSISLSRCSGLEREFKDVQGVEFTIEDGQLWVLQARSAKRTPRAALRFALDFVHEGLIAPEEALSRLEAST